MLATAMAAFTVGTPPASATSVGAFVFAGGATLACTGAGGGLSYPPAYMTFAFDVTVLPAARQCSWTFSSSFCMGASATALKPVGTVPSAFAPVCSISASGNLTGWCGLSNGAGGASIAITDPITGASATAFLKKLAWVDVGGTLVIHSGVEGPGPGQKGVMVGLAEAYPDPFSGSCVTASATGFIVAGVAAFYSSADTTVP
ncbi:MAG: hypothetical protein KY443_06720 [Actinobacteria bacterium]|nr:hypothetical protein [Actinomycetota bacterium]